ncbi:T9SS type A sorting domain-containing protein [Hymenobacter jeollabukensis]|uniref:T9SS type A sorting domain-containing protein n=1 Tax=Hymenobacter jeollabukensis TaxID=2025313 RepID=A0A5R8WQN1_9BACT|nr:T9SS type A sorting domain-containing protein [Hymenobacter jeollabukensis]TLM93057.1 T9SS type A sorting domain-containing protein [Hymenobacter jeollabukensis]
MKTLVLSQLARKAGLACAAVLAAGLSTEALAQTTTPVYKFWPLRVSGSDSANVRSANVTASTPTFKRLVLSNNQPVVDGSNTRPAVPQYSSRYGMAIAPTAEGGGWGTSAGGPGGTVNRKYYTQFTVTAAAGATARIDSVIATSQFILTASQTYLAVAYSKSGFVSDSAVVTGGIGPGGSAVGGGFPATQTLPADGPAPISLSQVNAGSNNINQNRYRLALNGTNGVILTGGQTLTLRFYFSCSSTGLARYAVLKDVLVKSLQTVTSNKAAKVTELAMFPNPAQNQLQINHAPAREGRINVYSTTGQKVASFTAQPNAPQTTVPVADLASGIYMVEYTAGNTRAVSRLVKQ